MIYNEQKRLMFIHNPKCGGTALSLWLQSNFGFVPYANLDEKIPETHIIEKHRYLSPDGFDGYALFTTYRHPIARWESFYRHYRGRGLTELPFDQFTIERKNHLLPQSYFLRPDVIWVPCDSMEYYMGKLLGLECEDPIVFCNESDKAIRIKWTNLLGRIIEEHFRQDFELLGLCNGSE
jgi:hypothetical protein